jgi:hypothetical protein
MSLDLWMESPSCPTCDHRNKTESFNQTYNVGSMWRLVFPGEKLVEIDGMPGKRSLKKLDKMLKELCVDPDKFQALNPENGWGSYDTFLSFIVNLANLARENPKWIWRACR